MNMYIYAIVYIQQYNRSNNKNIQSYYLVRPSSHTYKWEPVVDLSIKLLLGLYIIKLTSAYFEPG